MTRDPRVRHPFAGLMAVDARYHHDHRKGAEIMFDPATSRMFEGVGHMRYSRPCRMSGDAWRIYEVTW